MTESKPSKQKIKLYLIQEVSRKLDAAPAKSAQGHKLKTQELIEETYENIEKQVGLTRAEQKEIFTEVLSEITGFGPIDPLLADPEISEIMIAGHKQIYVEKKGKLEDTGITFTDEEHLMRIINRILSPLGRRVDVDNLMADARLPDGSRVNIAIPPVAVDGPSVTIRKFLESKLTMEQIIELGTATPHMAEFFEACVATRLNILITGNTSSGKTTLLNILTSYIPGDERIITIEDAAELKLNQKYVVRMETKMPNVDGVGGVITRDLVRNALRMRPDRIVVGEVRSEEALDMLQAMNTGHDGSLTTLHANSPRDAISRLETMAMMAGLNMPLDALRTQIASAIDLIIHMDRLADGTRKITHVAEVPRMEGKIVTLSDLFIFDKTHTDSDGTIHGEMKATGLRPSFTPRLKAAGFNLSGDVFGA